MLNMGALENPKHEKYAQELAKGVTKLKAYELAGYKPQPDGAAACRLSDKVRTRVDEIRRVTARKFNIDRATLTEMFLSDRQKSYESEQYGVAVKAAENIGKLYGLFIERHEHGGVGDFARMSDDELRSLAALVIEHKPDESKG